MSMQIIELVIDETAENVGVDAISVVEDPAIEVDFVALKNQVMLKSVDDDKRILLGPALIPNKQIYRSDAEFGEYYIFFSKDTVRKASELFLKASNQKNATFEHEYALNGMTVVESWIVENKEHDKSKLYEYDVPEGTWMVSMKVDNDEVWQDVKAGKVKGFSIEGHFADKLQMSRKKKSSDDVLQKIIDIINESDTK